MKPPGMKGIRGRDNLSRFLSIAHSRYRCLDLYQGFEIIVGDVFAVGEVAVRNFGSGSGVLSIATKDLPADLRQRCESPFEREVFDMLVTRGYRVIPQVPVGANRIDMVVEGDNDNRLAIECDGDQYHRPGQWDSDMWRQRVPERAGWRFRRCFSSTFVLQRDAVIAGLVETPAAHGVKATSADSQVKSIHAEQRRVRAFEQTKTPEQKDTIDSP
ncbi:MAG: hypothetical protein ACXW39_09135 [Nitrospira sp.]